MKGSVKFNNTHNGVSCGSSGTKYLYFPILRIETERELTDNEKKEINNVLVEYAAETLFEFGLGDDK